MSSDLEVRIAEAIARSSSLASSVASSMSSRYFDGDETDASVDSSSVINVESDNNEHSSKVEENGSDRNNMIVEKTDIKLEEKMVSLDHIVQKATNDDMTYIAEKKIDTNTTHTTHDYSQNISTITEPIDRLMRTTSSYAASLSARRAEQLEHEANNKTKIAALQRERAWCSIIPSPSGPTDEAPPLLATRSKRFVEQRVPPPSSLLQKPIQRNAPTTSPTISLQSRLLIPKAEPPLPPSLPAAKYIPGVGHSREWISVVDLSLQTRVPINESKATLATRPRARSASVSSGRMRSYSNVSNADGGDVAERLFYWAFETQKKREDRMNQAPDGCTFRPSLSKNATARKLSELPVPYLPESLIVGTSSTTSQTHNSQNDPTLSGRSSQSAAVVLPQKLLARHELLYASAVAREGRRRAREWAAYEGNPNFSFQPQIDRNTNALVGARYTIGGALVRGTVDSLPSSDVLTMNPSAENSIVEGLEDEVDVGRQIVSDRLYLEAENIEARRQIAADLELRRVATFHPKLNPKSLAMVTSSQRPRSRSVSVSSDRPRGGGIVRKPLTYIDPETTAEALALRKMRDELSRCTFAPVLVSQATKIRGRNSITSSSLKKPNISFSTEPAFERLTRLGELSQERLEQKRLDKAEKELEGNTFSPQINKNAESLMKQRLSNVDLGEPSSVESRLISEQRLLEERLNHRRAELAMLELASCSFSPAILPASKRMVENATKNGSAKRSVGRSVLKTSDMMYATPKITPSILRPSQSNIESPSAPAVSLSFSATTAPRSVNHQAEHTEVEVDMITDTSLHPPLNVSRAFWERLIDTAREFEHIRARVLQTVTRRALSALPLSLPSGPVKREVEKGCQELHRILIASRPHVPKSPETSPRAASATRTRENGTVAKESLPKGLRASRLILWDRLTDAMTTPEEQKCLRDDLTRLIESRTAPFLVRTLRPGSFALTVVEAVAIENHRSSVSDSKFPQPVASPSLINTSIRDTKSTVISAAESGRAAWATFALDAKRLDQVVNETSERIANAINSDGINNGNGNGNSLKTQYVSSEGEVISSKISTPESSTWTTMTKVKASDYSPSIKKALGI